MKFAQALNDYFIEEGIGWPLVYGQIITRGEKSFESAVKIAQVGLAEAGGGFQGDVDRRSELMPIKKRVPVRNGYRRVGMVC